MNTLAKNEHLTSDGEIVTGLPAGYQSGNQSLAVSLARAEVDQQIATARAFPRSVAQAASNILALATMDEETAKECIYALPRGGKPVKGPSIRFAEIVQSQWGNNRVGTRVAHVDRIEKYVESEGVFHDLETNAATTARVRRRLSNKEDRLLTEDMIIVTGNAASSIAKRNAILGGVPKAVWRQAYAAVERVLVGDIKTMAVKRDDALKAFAGFGITPERLYEALQIGGLEDIGPDEYTTLIGMHQALRNNEATVEEMFPAVKKPGDQPTGLKGKLDQLAGDGAVDKKPAADKAAPKSEAGSSPAGSDQSGKSPSPKAAAGNQPSSGASQAQSEPDDGDPIAKATRMGRAAYRRNMSKKAIPVDFKAEGREAERQAWLDGFAAEDDDENAPEPGSQEED